MTYPNNLQHAADGSPEDQTERDIKAFQEKAEAYKASRIGGIAHTHRDALQNTVKQI